MKRFGAPSSMPRETFSFQKVTGTSRSGRSPNASNTVRPRSTATSHRKDDIFFALAEEGFGLLTIRRRTPPTTRFSSTMPTSVLDHLRESVWRIYQFSHDHPEYFALMFLDRTVPRLSQADECFVSAREGKEQLRAQIQACIDAGALPAHAARRVALRLLTVGPGRHGRAALSRSHRAERERRMPSRATCSTSRSPASKPVWPFAPIHSKSGRSSSRPRPHVPIVVIVMVPGALYVAASPHRVPPLAHRPCGR